MRRTRSIARRRRPRRRSAVLVIYLGTILEQIDYNMETVVEHTMTGIRQLKADRNQESALPMRCIICLICTIKVRCCEHGLTSAPRFDLLGKR